MTQYATPHDENIAWLVWFQQGVREAGGLTDLGERYQRLSSVIAKIDQLTPYLDSDYATKSAFTQFLNELYFAHAMGRADPAWIPYARRLEREFHRSRILNYAEQIGIPVTRLEPVELYRADIRAFVAASLRPCTFFLGAGASRSAPANIPVVSELLQEVWRRARLLENNPLVELEAYCRAAGITNIEDVMTALFIGDVSVRRPALPGLLQTVLHQRATFPQQSSTPFREAAVIEQFSQTFNTFFSILAGTMLDAPPNAAHQEIADLTATGVAKWIVTTNYDACIERAFEEHGHTYDESLIKLHGSITWFYCGDCQEFSRVSIGELRKAIASRIPYPLVGMCPNCKGQVSQFLVPPTSFKWIRFPPLIEIWDSANAAITGAKLIVVIGYSFADADDYLVRTLLKSLADDPEKQLLILDPSLQVAERIWTSSAPRARLRPRADAHYSLRRRRTHR